jgi:hypothetical protein
MGMRIRMCKIRQTFDDIDKDRDSLGQSSENGPKLRIRASDENEFEDPLRKNH